MIGLYPNLLPVEFRKRLDYPEKLPELEGGDLEKGLLALTDYLNDVSGHDCTEVFIEFHS